MDLENLTNKVLDTDRPVVTLNGDLQKNEKSEGDIEEMSEEMMREQELEKLKALVKAKDNSIKTFITKSEALSSDVQNMRELINEKELSLRSLSDSFQAVNERCTFKTRQNQELEESNENLEDKVKVLTADNETGRRRLENLEDEIIEYQIIQDQNNDVILNQKQILRKRDEEIGQLKRDYDELIVREKDSMESVRKRANRSHIEAEEVKEQIRKVRERGEKEKAALFEELASTEAARADAVSKLNQAEGALRKFKEELSNTNNRLKQNDSEMNAMIQKFSGVNKEKNIAKEELSMFENQISNLNNEVKLSGQEIESLKIDNDTLAQQRDAMSQKIKRLQDELDEEKENTLKAELLLEETKHQTQTYLTELNGAKARIDHTVTASLLEEEGARKKWNKRLQESEEEVTKMIAKMKVSEKKRVQQTAEIEHLTFEVNQSEKNMVSLMKKLSQSELYIEEAHVREAETKERIESLKRRISDYSSQINTLKTEKEEEICSNRDLRLKIKSLQETVEDLEYNLENSERKKTEQGRSISRLTEQLEITTNSLSELEEDAEKSNSKADKAHKEILVLMEQHMTTMAEKDEEVELVKKTCRGTINLLKQNLEDAENEIRKIMLAKKDLEQEVMLLQGDLDEAEATVNELNDEIPRQQDILEQLGMNLTESSARAEALQDALIRADTKVTTLALKNDELEDSVKKEEIAKRQMEQENIDLNTKVSELTAKNNSLIDTCSKIEDQILEQTSLLEQLEEEKGDWVMSQRKYKEAITCLESDLQHSNDCKETLEENEVRLKSKIQEMLTDHEEQVTNLRQVQRVRIRSIEGRISELEEQLEEETTKRTDTEKTNKKLERALKDMEHQADEDTKAIERQLDQITSLTSRNKHLKLQCTDTETEVCTLQSRLRKVTVEMEETENRAATLSKVIGTPLSSRCNSPSLRQSALLRNSVLGRPGSRTNLMSPEVEQIIFSGRNSPTGPLSPRSRSNSGTNSPRLGFMSPSRPLSPPDLTILQNEHLTNGNHPGDVLVCDNEEISRPTKLELEENLSPDPETFDYLGICPTELSKEQTVS